MTSRIAFGAAYSRSSFSAKLGCMLNAVVTIPRLWARRRHERHALLQLDDHMLRDIGFDRTHVERMAARPFWRA